MNDELKEAVQFFKNEKAYDKLFQQFRKKYESLGRIGGNISVNEFSSDELEEIGQFFGLPGRQLRTKGVISLRQFEEQLSLTRFGHITLKQLLDAYFGEVIVSKKAQKLAKEKELQEFFKAQQERFPPIAFWLKFVYEKKSEARWILKIAEQERERLTNNIEILNKAFELLPQKAERLPMFSQRITGDPHAFDLHTELGRMFIHLLAVNEFNNDEMTDAIEFPEGVEEINELLEDYQIYRDDLLNFVTCANLIAETELGVHPVWEIAAKHNTVQLVPLRELIPILKVAPASGTIVWIVENSGVCSTLLDHEPSAPMICTNGQFTLAALMLMDLLVENGCQLYYAGDFDPEGLRMADRLIERYSGSIQLWHMDKKAYYKTKSSKVLSKERLEKLHHIKDERLQEVADEMKKKGKAGYQEALVDWLLEDLKKVK